MYVICRHFIKKIINFVHHVKGETFWAPFCNSIDVLPQICKKETVSLALFLWFKTNKK
jgi:hypothetical protein